LKVIFNLFSTRGLQNSKMRLVTRISETELYRTELFLEFEKSWNFDFFFASWNVCLICTLHRMLLQIQIVLMHWLQHAHFTMFVYPDVATKLWFWTFLHNFLNSIPKLVLKNFLTFCSKRTELWKSVPQKRYLKLLFNYKCVFELCLNLHEYLTVFKNVMFFANCIVNILSVCVSNCSVLL